MGHQRGEHGIHADGRLVRGPRTPHRELSHSGAQEPGSTPRPPRLRTGRYRVVEQRRPDPHARWEPDPVPARADADQVATWYAHDDKASALLPRTLGYALLVSFPGWVLLFTGRSGFYLSVPITLGLLLLGVVTGVTLHVRER